MRTTLTGAVLGLIGAAMLLFEGVRAIPMNDVLSSASQVVMWIGLGVMAVGGVLLIVGAWQTPAAGPSDLKL